MEHQSTIRDIASLEELLSRLDSSPQGLTTDDASRRLADYHRTHLLRRRRPAWQQFAIDNLRNPLILLLICLGIVSFVTGDLVTTTMIAVMIIIGTALRYVQEARSERAVESLQRLVHLTTTVVRDAVDRTVRIDELVQGDVLQLTYFS